jgi:Zn-finger nucleic acid-binding protein
MNCPGCGAAMRIVGNHNYFHCDHCDRFEFPEETGDGVVSLKEPSTKSCPVCHVLLEKAVIEAEDVRFCPRCRGFMAPLGAFGRIVNKRRALHGPHEQVLAPFDPEELKRVLACPLCDRKMETHPYFGGGNAVVNTCGHCGWIWLDAGELAVIERYVPHVAKLEPVLPISQESTSQGALLLHPFLPIGSLDDLL